MNNDFEFDNDNLHFDEIDDFEDNFDVEMELELEEIYTRTAILLKNNMFALLCLKTASKGGAICRVDPREQQPSVQLYDDAEKAQEWFSQSLKTSSENGWKIVYSGLPLQG